MIKQAMRAEAIRTMYGHARVTLAAALVLVAYMTATSLPFTPWPHVLIWAVCVILLQVSREILVRSFLRAAPDDQEVERWARYYTIQQFITGLVWGSTMFLFGHPDQPITIALVLCCLYSIGSASVTSHAYNLPTMIALVAPIFGCVAVRLVATGDFAFTLVGIATTLYAATLVGYCRIQAKSVMETIAIRFENRDLVEALKVENAVAEAARRDAERANLAKSQFLAAASHDLRQPLYALSLFSASLESLKLDSDGRSVVSSIQRSLGAMENLFVGLLDLSKFDAGVIKPRLAAVSIDDLFDRLSQTFGPIAEQRGLDLRFRSNGEFVESDATLLEQTLGNLVSNALRYTQRGGVLVAARKRTSLRLEVYDTGIGIAPEDMERIFDEFVQIENPERDRSKGMGLGLAIARRSAALVGAVVDVASRPGRGSRFGLSQPYARSQPSAAAQPDYSDLAAAAAHDVDAPVLVVDDDRDVRSALEDLLRRWGIPSECFADASEALARIDSGARYRLALVDYRLAGAANGLDLIDEIRRRGDPAPPCALITGDFDPDLIKQAEMRGTPLFHKPVRPEQLRALFRLDPAAAMAGPG